MRILAPNDEFSLLVWTGPLQHTIDDRCSEIGMNLSSRAEQRSTQCFSMQMLIAHDLDA